MVVYWHFYPHINIYITTNSIIFQSDNGISVTKETQCKGICQCTTTLKRKCLHFDEIFITGCPGSCQNDNFQCSQWLRFRQNDDIFVSVNIIGLGNGTIPSHKSKLVCCRLDLWQIKFQWNMKQNASFSFQENCGIWKYCLPNISHFVDPFVDDYTLWNKLQGNMIQNAEFMSRNCIWKCQLQRVRGPSQYTVQRFPL